MDRATELLHELEAAVKAGDDETVRAVKAELAELPETAVLRGAVEKATR